MKAIEKTKPAIERIGLEVWNEAELSQAEHKSAQIHVPSPGGRIDGDVYRITK
jgi:hypothetical protein